MKIRCCKAFRREGDSCKLRYRGAFPFDEQEMTKAKKKDRSREEEKHERQVGAGSQEISHKVLGTPHLFVARIEQPNNTLSH